MRPERAIGLTQSGILSPSGLLPNPEDRPSPLAGDQSGLIGGEALSHSKPPSSAAGTVQPRFQEAGLEPAVPKDAKEPETPSKHPGKEEHC